MLAALDRILLGRKTECVPAHRMENVEAAHPLVTRDDIGGGVTFRMSDMQTRAARIRKHVEDVKFRFAWIEICLARIGRVKCAAFIPDRLPFRFDLVVWGRFGALGT